MKQSANLFAAEAAYADSIFRTALRDTQGSIDALHRSLRHMPTYAPAILAVGSVEYQLGHIAKGKKLFHRLLELSKDTEDICEIIDKAGDFLIQSEHYKDGLDLFRKAAKRYPKEAVFHQRISCCASHLRFKKEAIAAARAALAIKPNDQECLNDLGWSLYKDGKRDEARVVLEKAVALNKKNKLAVENLRICLSGESPDA